MEKGKESHWILESKDQNPHAGSAITFVNLELDLLIYLENENQRNEVSYLT